MGILFDLGKQAARDNEPGAYILNDEAAEIVSGFERGTAAWNAAISEFVSGFSSERLRLMGK